MRGFWSYFAWQFGFTAEKKLFAFCIERIPLRLSPSITLVLRCL
jgi:hypothetical protein